jgi:hypothetical protein
MVAGTKDAVTRKADLHRTPSQVGYSHEFEPVAKWANWSNGAPAQDKFLELIKCRELRIIGQTVQLVPGAALVHDAVARSKWAKQRCLRKPRGFVDNRVRVTAARVLEGDTNAHSRSN